MRYVEYAGAYVCVGCGMQLLPNRPEGIDQNTAIARLVHPVTAPRGADFLPCPYSGKEGIIKLEIHSAA